MVRFLCSVPLLLVLGGCDADGDGDTRLLATDEVVANSGNLDKQSVQHILDSVLGDRTELGGEEGWDAYFDHERRLLVARRGTVEHRSNAVRDD
jgi:hypothetical protein